MGGPGYRGGDSIFGKLYRKLQTGNGLVALPAVAFGKLESLAVTVEGGCELVALLKVDGVLTIVGAPEKPLPTAVFALITGRRSFAGSGIGGLPETQEMLDFCAQNNIVSDVEVVPIQKINEAYERMLRSDVKYRFVIDMASLRG